MLDQQKKLILWEMNVEWCDVELTSIHFKLTHPFYFTKEYKVKPSETLNIIVYAKNIIITYNDLLEYINDPL